MFYEIRALRDTGVITALSVEALDESDATGKAAQLGYVVLSVRLQKRWAGVWPGRRRVRFPLVLFSQELLALLGAGLTLVEAIETLAEKEHHPEIKKVLEGVIARLREGHPLSFALQQYPAHFPELYVASVRASERTGGLSESLTRFVTYQTQVDVVRRKLISASIYPALLVVVGLLVSMFLLVYVVPKFSRVYEDVGANLPFLSQMLLAWGRTVEAHGMTILFGATLVIGGAVYGLTRPVVRRRLVEKLWQMPSLREHLHVYQLARFYRTLGMLQRGGIPILRALDMAAGLLSPGHRNSWRKHRRREGQSMSQAMDRHGLTTPVAVRMLRVGERSGRMGEMMERIASFYDEEISRWVEWFTRLIEPLLMAVIGIIIGGIVVLMYFPIFELAGSIQ
jgi:general secretion pathway protein F